MRKLNFPIPGQSLTDTPKNAPWENPPEIVDPEEAIMYHIDRLNDEERTENMMFLLEYGVDVQTLVSGILRAAVVEGIHTVDVSLIIAPVLHEFIVGNAKALNVKFDEGFEEKGRKEKLEYTRNRLRARKMLSQIGESQEPEDISEEPVEVEEEITTDTMASQPEPKGLMARAT